MKGNNNISSEAALKLLKAAEEKSRDLGVKMNIAVVDSGANLVGFLRSVYQYHHGKRSLQSKRKQNHI